MSLNTPKIGVSACLLGNNVRFDGGHKRNSFLLEQLNQHVDFLPICPEVEIGLGIPRRTLQLRQGEHQLHMVYSKDPSEDITEQMLSYAMEKVETLGELDGLIVKKDSPSCGMERVAVVINDKGYRSKQGAGLFTQTFMQRWPLIPVEEEGRLNDMALRENFFERIFAYRRWKQLDENSVKAFIQFHSSHKLMLMARGHHLYRELGNMVAGVTAKNLPQRKEQYIHRFMQVMALRSRRGSHVNVLQHIMGYLKDRLSSAEKHELLRLFEAYRKQHYPLSTPLVMLRYHLRNQPHHYISNQHYLSPFPEDLSTRLWV